MKMTKRLMAMAACAVMAASSMVGMSASAASSDTTNAVYIGTAFRQHRTIPQNKRNYAPKSA